MNTKQFIKLKGIGRWAVVFALFGALLLSGTVFAEGEVPPEEPAAAAPAASEPPAEAPAAPAQEPSAPAEPVQETAAEPPTENTPVEEEPIAEAPVVDAPAEEAPVVEAPVAEAPVTDAPVGETPLEEAPVVEVPVELAPAVESLEPVLDTPAAEPLAEIAAEAAESGVVLVDESGSELPLTETSSAELLGGGDPYYKVGLTEYNFYAAGGICGIGTYPYCQDNQGSDVIQDALDYMFYTGLPSNRMLYVQGGTYGGFTVDGSSRTWLTLLNGVIGEDGSENTHIDGDIIVSNNTGGFTLSGFSVDSFGSIYFGDNSGTLKLSDVTVRNSDGYYDYALQVREHAGAVVLEGVNVSDNAENGADIDNTKGSYPITIKNSAFNNNGWTGGSDTNFGLQVASNSIITIDGVSASDNNGDGLDISDYATLNLKNAFLSWNNSNASGWGYGLYSGTDGSGSANLENVYAYGNDFGLYLEGGSLNAKYIEANDSGYGNGLNFYSVVGSSKVEYGQFHNNYGDGLHIENKGAIYLNSVNSSDNGGAGVYLDNAYGSYDEFTGSGAVTITSPATGGSQLANGFFNNDLDGVTIFSRGNVLISNADMNDNDGMGLFVDNSYGLGSVTVNATIPDWTNGFYGNGNGGVVINSQGAVKLSGISSEWNGTTGIHVYTMGTIELLNVNSANNFASGAFLFNNDAPLPRNVTLTNSSFDHNNGSGLLVYSYGSIIAYGLSASGNSIRNQDMGYATYNVTYHDLLGDGWVEDTYTFYGVAGQAVNLHLESEDFDTYLELYNPGGGLYLYNDDGWYDTNSKITVASLPATGDWTVVVKSYENNGSGEYLFSLNDEYHDYATGTNYYGAYLDTTNGNGSVSINKPKDLNRMWGNFFGLNTYIGLQVASNGTILIDSAAAENNFDAGVYLDNPTSLASVTVSNSRTDDFYSGFSGNSYHGVYIATRGNVTLKNIGAWENGSTGVYVDNCQFDSVSDACLGFGSVKVLALADRSNDFGWNDGDGLYIYSKGAILLTNINAENNAYSGVEAYNSFSGSSASVTVTTAGTNGWNSFFGNGWYGLGASSNGGIVLSKVDASENGFNGVYLDNESSPTSAGILITRGYFNRNGQNGLEAYSEGAINWKYGDAWDNGWAGALLNNVNGSAGISVLGTSKERMGFGGNGWSASEEGDGGLLAYSSGKIILGYARAENNNGDGFLLDNSTSATNQMVDVTEVETRWNHWTGLDVYSMGAITIKGISSEGNDYDGAYLQNNYADALGNVTVTTTAAWTTNDLWGNDYSGLTIYSKGGVSLKNINAWENGWEGVFVDNTEGTGTVTFTTTGRQYWLSNNGSYGLYISSNGSVTLNNQYGINARDNGGDAGVYIYNYNGLPTSTVSLTNVFANNNYNGSGIVIYAESKVTAVSTTAQNNAGSGLYIVSGTGGVTLSGSNYLTDNPGSGLIIQAPGAISISNVRAWSNGNEGIYVYGFSANITLYNVIAAHNKSSGIYLQTNGNYNLNKVTAFLNGQADAGGLYDDGLAIRAGSSSMVTILNSTFMQNWWGSGIEILHPNPAFWPTLTNVSYLSNGDTNLWVH